MSSQTPPLPSPAVLFTLDGFAVEKQGMCSDSPRWKGEGPGGGGEGRQDPRLLRSARWMVHQSVGSTIQVSTVHPKYTCRKRRQ